MTLKKLLFSRVQSPWTPTVSIVKKRWYFLDIQQNRVLDLYKFVSLFKKNSKKLNDRSTLAGFKLIPVKETIRACQWRPNPCLHLKWKSKDGGNYFPARGGINLRGRAHLSTPFGNDTRRGDLQPRPTLPCLLARGSVPVARGSEPVGY